MKPIKHQIKGNKIRENIKSIKYPCLIYSFLCAALCALRVSRLSVSRSGPLNGGRLEGSSEEGKRSDTTKAGVKSPAPVFAPCVR